MIFPDRIIRQLESVLPRQVWYRDYYLKSRHWQRFKRKIKKNTSGCADCKRSAGGFIYDVHHLPSGYANLWNEKPEDVVVLCRDCHKKRHKKSPGR